MGVGFVGGAALGFAVAGPAGLIGGGIGGAVLGPFVQWVRGLPNIPAPSFRPAPADLVNTGSNLRQAPPLAPFVAPPNPANQILTVGRQNLRQVAPPAPFVAPPNPADQILTVGRQNLRQVAPPAPFAAAPNPADQILNAGRQNLRQVAAPIEAPARNALPGGWGFNKPRVVDISEQTRGKTLAEMIELPEGVTTGNVLFRVGGHPAPSNAVLKAGVHNVAYRYAAPTRGGGTFSGPIYQTALHVKPSINELMTAMGFQPRGWRWELAWGHHGTLNNDFHLTVPQASQRMPNRMDNLDAILDGLFPLGQGLTGTHMTIECRQTAGMSNAAWFLNGQSKYPQGYSVSEAEQYVKACKSRLLDWKSKRRANLKSALATL